MNGIIGTAELMRDTALKPQHEQGVATIIKSSHALLAIIKDILDFSKIETKGLVLTRAAFFLPDIVQDVAALLRPVASTNGVDLQVEYDSLQPSSFYGDKNKIRQILLNLTGNAVKFTKEGQVILSVFIQTKGDVTDIIIRVRDTGIGIEPSRLSHIFTPFAQADESTTRNFGGTGLGLTISHELASLMAGSLTATSEPDIGSVFSFHVTLPNAPEIVQPEDSAMTFDGFLEGVTLLIADDNEINQTVFSQQLEVTRANIVVAKNGVEAVKCYENTRPEIIMLDLAMPVMGGIDAAHKIREIERETDRPATIILAVSANILPEIFAHCEAAGINGFIQKPVLKETLLTKIHQAITAEEIGTFTNPNMDGETATNNASDFQISPAYLDQMVEIMGQERLCALIEKLIAETDLELSRALGFLSAGQHRDAARIFHRLAGSTGALGAEQISLELQTVETMIISGDILEMAKFDRIQRLWSETRRSFEQWAETQTS